VEVVDRLRHAPLVGQAGVDDKRDDTVGPEERRVGRQSDAGDLDGRHDVDCCLGRAVKGRRSRSQPAAVDLPGRLPGPVAAHRGRVGLDLLGRPHVDAPVEDRDPVHHVVAHRNVAESGARQVPGPDVPAADELLAADDVLLLF
jgi:hypothetical protein